MEWTGLNELREKFLSFFESKGHLKLPSFSLIPKDDNSLLLINSGMAPMKKFFTGEATPPRARVTTCQKCIRTPDIERVGVTARHITYFEMLGNFSFGDYFKNEVTAWAWEFCTKVLNLPEDKLWVTIYENDDEACDIWTKKVGVNPSHMVRLGKEDNFWEHGTGPCGPCSELYFDRGKKYSCGKPTCSVGCDCDRYVEFWNLVFTQFEKDEDGNYNPLEHPNIDTGMGLERLACIMQGVDNVFLIDTMQNIMKHVCKIAGIEYGNNPKTDVSLRVITDHVRSTSVMIADGVLPSNEGRGYVLRRLLRRAARQGRLIGITEPFLYKVCETVIEENQKAYPELVEKSAFIKKLIKVEEENFSKTIDQGLLLLNELIENSNGKTLSGEDAFKLNDTYGFPIDLTKEILEENSMSVDEKRFNELLLEQKNRARNARQDAGADAWKADGAENLNLLPTEFVGYETLSSKSKIIAILKDNEDVPFANKGDCVNIVLDVTPFYAESGGQSYDIGVMKNELATLNVETVTKNLSGVYFHKVKVASGTISVGDSITAQVNQNNRLATAKNHTAAHLLQAALRSVLGEHVEQAGQLVNAKEMRFDFTHFSALTKEEISKVEKLVNEQILKGINLEMREMPIERAKELGAMALFGDKYGEMVRVVKIDDFSIELCGGTHIDNTAKLGGFKIVSENSVASGVRRIEAVTGTGILNLLNNYIEKTSECAKILKISNTDEIFRACAQMLDDIKDKEKIIDQLNSELAAFRVEDLLKKEKDINGTKLIVAKFSGISVESLKSMCDKIKDKLDNFVAVLASVTDDKANIICCVAKKTQASGFDAGKIVREVAHLAGGNGGGKPDMAMAGIKNLNLLDRALDSVENILTN
ncbi:MAG: Alanine--tRNA ligase [Eubacteriales bacterium SKADARSKE-1]|nr:Alanine--tRNA ligase [Eubacteriales bacterium SKADARSKE-1]